MATDCRCGRPESISSRILELTTALLDPLWSGITITGGDSASETAHACARYRDNGDAPSPVFSPLHSNSACRASHPVLHEIAPNARDLDRLPEIHLCHGCAVTAVQIPASAFASASCRRAGPSVCPLAMPGSASLRLPLVVAARGLASGFLSLFFFGRFLAFKWNGFSLSRHYSSPVVSSTA